MARQATVSIQVTGATKLQKALRILAEPDAPFLRAAMTDAGQMLDNAASSRGKGGIGSAVQFAGVSGKSNGLRALIKVKHPGAKAMEFGRTKYYRGYTGRRQRSGQQFRSRPGQKANPYIGIVKGDAAIAAVGPQIRRLFTEAIDREWDRIGAEA